MGLGQEDTFQPNFQSKFRSNVQHSVFTELDKPYVNELDKIDSESFVGSFNDRLPEVYGVSNEEQEEGYARQPEFSSFEMRYPGNFQGGKEFKDNYYTPAKRPPEPNRQGGGGGHRSYQRKQKFHYNDISRIVTNSYGSDGKDYSRESHQRFEGDVQEEEVLQEDGTKLPMNGLEHSAKRARFIGPLTEVTAVAGGRAVLPCDVRPTLAGDTTIIVLFYHGVLGTPVYSVDARDGTLGDHWHDEDTLGTRARFELDLDPPGLVIDPVLPSDHNLYRCRVDFKSSPTRNSRVRLKVIESPEKIIVVNAQGLEVSSIIGPYAVGETVSLRCEVMGGRPRPTVSWLHEDTVLDDVSEDHSGDVTVNTLILEPLKRDDLFKILTCQGSNSNLTIPVATTVTLDVNFPPLTVQMNGLQEPLLEGNTYDVTCEAKGSRPRAMLSWWKDGVRLPAVDDQVFREGNISRSRLRLQATVDDDDSSLTCRADNPQVPDSVMQDSQRIVVHYSPILHLSPGQSLDMNNIKEGVDAYFECNIRANPKTFRVEWSHNGSPLHHNVTRGVILSNQSLVLQRVNRSSSGEYVCSASNVLGQGTSQPVSLNVKFAPVCQDTQQSVYGGGKNEHLNVTCAVHAHPTPSVFRWAFNSSSEVNDIANTRYSVVGEGVSQVWYTPRSHLDYGSLLCWATNDVGMQQEPCVFHIIHASVPEPVHNCSVSDVGPFVASVRCHAGWDGGLPQTFTLSVSQGERSGTMGATNGTNRGAPRVLANTSSSPKPDFSVTGLESGKEYVLTITAVNSRGHSNPVSLAIKTHTDKAQKRTSPDSVNGSLTAVLAVILGTTAVILLMCVGVVMFLRSRRNPPPGGAIKMTVYPVGKESTSPTLHVAHSQAITEFESNEEPSPDLIPEDHHSRQTKIQESVGGRGSLSSSDSSLASDSPGATGPAIVRTPQQGTSLYPGGQYHQRQPQVELTPTGSSGGGYTPSSSVSRTGLDSSDSGLMGHSRAPLREDEELSERSSSVYTPLQEGGPSESKEGSLGRHLAKMRSGPPYMYSQDNTIVETPESDPKQDYHPLLGGAPSYSTQTRDVSPLYSTLPHHQSLHYTSSLLPRSSLSPPPLPTSSPTPLSSYNSLPRGARPTYSVSKGGGVRDLETKPYPSTSTAFSTIIVRTAPHNLATISTRGLDSTRESSV